MNVLRLFIMPLIVCVALLCSCTPQVPSQYIQQDDMEDILYDYHLAQAMAERSDERTEAKFNETLYYHAVLEKHGVTEADFDSSLVYYYTYTDRLTQIYNNISKRLEDEALRLGTVVGGMDKYSQYSADGDTANVWSDATSMVLTPHSPYNKFTFKIETDSTYLLGDKFLFQFDADFLIQDGSSREANICMVLRYKNDSVATYNNIVRRDGPTQMTMFSDMKVRLKEICGFVFVGPGVKQESMKILFLDKVQLVRFHKPGAKATTTDDEDEDKMDTMMDVPTVDRGLVTPLKTMNNEDIKPLR